MLIGARFGVSGAGGGGGCVMPVRELDAESIDPEGLTARRDAASRMLGLWRDPTSVVSSLIDASWLEPVGLTSSKFMSFTLTVGCSEMSLGARLSVGLRSSCMDGRSRPRIFSVGIESLERREDPEDAKGVGETSSERESLV